MIAGLRGFFRQIGGVIGTAAIVVALSLSPDKAAGMRLIYTTLGLALFIVIPLAFLIPDTARDRRQAAIAKAAVAKATAVREQAEIGGRAIAGGPPTRGAI